MDTKPKVQVLQTECVKGRAVFSCPLTGERLAACTPVRNLRPKTARHTLKPISVLSKKAQKVKKALVDHTKAINARDSATKAFIKEKKEQEARQPAAPQGLTQQELRAILVARLKEQRSQKISGSILATKAKARGFQPPPKPIAEQCNQDQSFKGPAESSKDQSAIEARRFAEFLEYVQQYHETNLRTQQEKDLLVQNVKEHYQLNGWGMLSEVYAYREFMHDNVMLLDYSFFN